jgi:capsid protein
MLEVRRMFRRWQHYFIGHFCWPSWNLFIEEAWLRGELPNVPFYDDPAGYSRCVWTTPGWGWVDPTKEIEASLLGIESGLSTLAEEAAGQGRDWEENLEQRSRERARAKELRLNPDMPVNRGKSSQDAAPAEPRPGQADPNNAREAALVRT